MFKILSLFLCFSLLPSVTAAKKSSFESTSARQFIVWNVGQGLWTTEVHPEFCIHYDMGGERNVARLAAKLCGSKKNVISLSHWDWDHISFAASFASRVRDVCLIRWPDGKPSSFKLKQIQKIPLCQGTQQKGFSRFARLLWDPLKVKNSNDRSDILFSKQFEILLPGDSPKSQEKFWTELVPRKTKGLLLGHHGSHTSTSAALLNQMPELRWAVASARSARYRHPHLKVIRLLKSRKIPLLRTEDWGHLHFQGPS